MYGSSVPIDMRTVTIGAVYNLTTNCGISFCSLLHFVISHSTNQNLSCCTYIIIIIIIIIRLFLTVVHRTIKAKNMLRY